MRFTAISFYSVATAGVVLLSGCKDSTAPHAESIAAMPGTAASAVAGSSVPVPPSFKVSDGSGKGFAGVTVRFSITAGDGTFTTLLPTVVTDADGVAAVTSWTLGRTAGPNTLTATADGLTGNPVAVTVTGVAGPPASMNPAAGNAQNGTVGAPVGTAPSVKVTDANANPVSGIAVTFAAGLGGGSVTGANATTNAAGLATVGSWTLGTTAGTNILTATAPSLQPVQFGVTAAAGAATRLVVATQPSQIAFNNVVLATQPVVQVQDVYNNVVASSTAPVTAAISSGTGTLGGTMTVSAVAGVATFTNLVVSGFTATGNIAFSFSAPSLAGATSAGVATAPAANLTIDGLYITQSTQTYTRGVPLIASRAGFLRVFVKASGANTFAPAVRVRLYQGANLTTPVQTYTITAPASVVPTTISEASLTSSWNVAIPANLIQPGLSILADVDPAASLPEPAVDNAFPLSGVPMSLDVRTTPPLRVTFVPVVQPGPVNADITDANIPTYMDYAMRVYPISSYEAVVHAPFTNSVVLAAAYDNTWNDLLAQMNALRALESPLRNYYGVLHPTYSFGGTGLGYIGQGATAAVGVDWTGTVQPSTNTRSMTVAHEMGHNFGRQHINCGGPANPDPFYPYDPTTIGVTGYDVVLNALRATTLADFMSYCSPLWISDYTFKAILAYRGPGAGPVTAPAQHGLLVWGHVGPGGVVLEPSFEVEAPISMPAQSGAYRVRGTDDAGGDVFNISFDGVEVDHIPGERHFAYVIPLPAAGRKPATIRLTANGLEAIQRSTLPSAPGAALAAPLAAARATATQRSRLSWDAARYPMALVRDPATGQVLSFARGGQLDLATPGQSLDITFSDGVRSVRQIVAIAPR